jgi:cytoskeletal protein CcmA (bactofilin family)
MSKRERVEEKNSGGTPECLIGRGSLMDGRLSCKGMIRVEGECRGRLSTDGTLVIAEGARVEAEIEAENVIIAGFAGGTISARNFVHIASTARVRAEIRSRRFKIEAGGLFEGNASRIA